ncbi:MAG: TonB-dependent receptor [Bacteroidota bacterium]|nr:TonB-dependent receptor [Bacteroidota bacterium]
MKKLYILLITAFVSFSSLFAQQVVKGKIIDDENLPLPGVSVLVKGKTQGTVCDMDGNYSITVSSSDVLVFSMIGMISQEIPVGKQTVIDVKLSSQVKSLNEVVVVGFGSAKVKDLTAPIQTVKSSDIISQTTSNPAQALQGKVAGMVVTNSGEPGSDPQIRIRGLSTAMEAGSGPLYVVDGTIVKNISFLSNNDIESITVLKDASAGAIYGVQAANGVILVTTKKGKKGAPEFSFSAYTGIQHPTNILKMANTNQYLDLLNQRTGLTGAGSTFNPSDYTASTQWYDKLTRNPVINNYELSVSGGSDKSSYTYGISYFNQNGIIKTGNSGNNNNFERLNFRAKNDYDFTKNFSAGYNLIFSKTNNTPGYNYAFFQAYVTPPAYAPHAADGKWSDPTALGFSGSFANPLASVYYYNDKQEAYSIIPSTYVNVKFLKDFTFKSSLGSDIYYNMERNYTPVFYVSGIQNNTTSNLNKTNTFRRNFMWDNTLEYRKIIEKNEFKFMAGSSLQDYYDNFLNGLSYNVPDVSNATLYLTTGDDNDRYANDGGNKYRVLSYFSRLNYTYDSKYLLIATIRADGSSKYNDHWGYFPSVGLGWVASEEPFLKDVKWIDFLKLRASWGELGNNNVPANSSVIVGKPSAETTGIFGGNTPVTGITFQTVYNNYLKWETLEEYDGGFELYTLKNRLSVEMDYYRRITHNAVFTAPISGISGTESLLGNNGKIQNQGIELVLGWSDKSADGNFKYSISANVATVQNKVLSINNLSGTVYGPITLNGEFVTKTVKGKPIGSFYGYKVAGVFQSDQDINNYQSKNGVILQPDALAGDLKFANTNGDDKINEGDRTFLGSPIPKVTYGVNGNLGYKNWDFSLAIQGVAGNKIFNYKRANRNAFPDANFDYDFYKNHWTGKGSTNSYPSAVLTRKNISSNSFYVESGSYVRIRSMQLGYSLPEKTLSNLKIKQLRLYVTAQNPITLFSYNGYTPEIGGDPISAGIDNQTYPLSAIYSIGFNLTF